MKNGKLVIEDVGLTYSSSRGQVAALKNVCLSILPGEFVSILGPSGCGKSSLLRVVSGLESPTTGKVMLDRQQVTEPLQSVGVVFQRPTLLPWLSVCENVRFPLRARSIATAEALTEVDKIISMVGLEEFSAHYPYELSGGMQQRVAIARAFAQAPSLLLMDEPFAALDAMTREHMMVELQKTLQMNSASVMFITHSIPEAVFLSDRVLVLSERPGCVVKECRVDLPRPRTVEMLDDPEYLHINRQLRHHFESMDL